MIIKNVSLETVCGITSKLPENIHPEVAFAGKSNVGKSSLINGLMNRKSLARKRPDVPCRKRKGNARERMEKLSRWRDLKPRDENRGAHETERHVHNAEGK